MFSRLLSARRIPLTLTKLPLASSIIPSSTCSTQIQQQQFRRLFHKQSNVFNAAPPVSVGTTAVTPVETASTSTTTSVTSSEKQPSSFSSIISKYGGWYPFIGLSSVIVLSQEILVLNEEGYQLLLTGSWLLFVGVFAVDYLKAPLKEMADADLKELNDHTGLVIDYIEYSIDSDKKQLQLYAEIPKYRDEYISLVKKATISSDVRNRLAARESVLQRLQSLKQREVTEKNRQATALYDDALAHVRSEVKKLSKQDKDAIVNYAIRSISGDAKSLPASEDPIVRLFDNYIKSRSA